MTTFHRPRLLFLSALWLAAAMLLGACQPPTTGPAAATAEPTVQAEPDPVADPEPGAVADPEATGDFEPAAGDLVIYSGRNENLIGPLIEQFEADTGIEVAVRYGGTAEMAATILEEGTNSPADVFYGQDAGALGALSDAGVLTPLPDDVLAQVEPRFRSRKGDWVGVSGRARVLVYNSEQLSVDDLPEDVWGLTEPEWQGRVGWAPTNGSFQAFVTALRVLEGEEQARAWLEAMIANDVQPYANNTAITEAVGRGEIAVGLVNHYYLMRFIAEQGESYPARNYHFPSAGAGAMINVAGVGVLASSEHQTAALNFLRYLFTQSAQEYFARETHEYPLVPGVSIDPMLPPLASLQTPDLDLGDLSDLQGTLQLLQDTGALF